MEDGEVQDDNVTEHVTAAEQLARVPGLTFCPQHKPGQMVEICLTCRAVLSMVKPDMAKQLIIPNKSTSAVHRYASRSDEQLPSLVFPAGLLELAENVFNSGMYRSKAHWLELVNKYLTLPPDQHERLVKDLEMEAMFRTYQSDARFRFIFKYRKELGDALKMLRITQRIVFGIVNVIDEHIPKLRKLGLDAGVAFPEVAPARQNPKVPKQFLDSLAIASTEDVFRLPSMSSVFEGVSGDLTSTDRAQIKRNLVVLDSEFEDYRKSCVDQFMELFRAAAKVASDCDDGFAFYLDTYGHVDSSIRELLRSKLVNLFKADIRQDVLRTDSKVKTKPLGLLGGEEKVRTVLTDFTKQDDLLKKTIVAKDRRSRGQKAGTSGSRKKSRSRSPVHKRNSYNNNKGGQYKNNRGGSKSKGRNNRGGNKSSSRNDSREDDDEDVTPKDASKAGKGSKGKGKSKKGEFLSLASAWPTFFTAVALLMVLSLGLAVTNIR